MASSEDHRSSGKVRKVDLAKLQVDPTYQRVPSPALVDTVERDWDEISSGRLLVSDRGARNGGDEEGMDANGVIGGLFLVDGQHRSLAARRKGLKQLEALVIDLTEEADPAMIEAKYRLNTNVGLRDRATERFKAQLRSGDAESVDIVKVLAQAGTEIQFNPAGVGGLTCIATIEQLYRADDVGAVLRNTLEVIREAYGDYHGKAGTAAMLKSMAWFLIAHYEDVDHTRLIEKLKEIQAEALDRRARTMQGTLSGSLWFNYYRAIVDLYNERLTDNRKLEWISKGASRLGGRARREQ